MDFAGALDVTIDFGAAVFFAAAFLTTAFLRAGAAFFAGAFAAAFCKRQRFFVAAMILFIPSSLIRRFGFVGSGVVDGSDSPRIFAHRRFCDWAIFRLTAAENFLRLRVGAPVAAAAWAGPPGSIARSSAILASSFSFWASIPKIAAFKISVVSFGVGM